MQTVRRVAALTPADRRLVAAAFVAVVGAWAEVRLFPIGRVVDCGRRIPRFRALAGAPPRRIGWAVEAVGRRLRTSCLVQAVAACALASSAGWKADLRVGLRRRNGRLHAHAWAVCEGCVIVGGPDVSDLVPLPSLGKP